MKLEPEIKAKDLVKDACKLFNLIGKNMPPYQQGLIRKVFLFTEPSYDLPDMAYYEDLTARESEIFELIVEDLLDKEIAEKLFIAKSTVSFHKTNLFSKLGINSNKSCILLAIKLGIIN